MRRIATTFAAASLLSLTVVGTATAAPPVERNMQLECEGSDLAIMRSNGSSWWGLDADRQPDGTVYVTTTLEVTNDAGSVYSHSYGQKTGLGGPTTCVAEHFGFTWTVGLVRSV